MVGAFVGALVGAFVGWLVGVFEGVFDGGGVLVPLPELVPLLAGGHASVDGVTVTVVALPYGPIERWFPSPWSEHSGRLASFGSLRLPGSTSSKVSPDATVTTTVLAFTTT